MPSLTDPIWSVIGVIATIIFGFVGVAGVVVTFIQLIQSRKQFSYEVQSIAPLFTVAEGFQDQIEIKLHGELVRNVYFAVIDFSNSGRASIRPDDFIRPLKVSSRSGRIISADIINTVPPGIGELIKSKDYANITFEKILLNRGDKFSLRLLISEFTGNLEDIDLDVRIDGVKQLTETKGNSSEFRYFAKGLLEFLILGTIAAIPLLGSLVVMVWLAYNFLQNNLRRVQDGSRSKPNTG